MKVSKGIELRDIETDKTLRRLQDFKGRAFWGTFSAAGNLVAIMNMNNAESTDFFDVDSGKLISQLPRPRDESRRRIDVISPQGTYFATNSEVHRIELFDVKSAKPLRKLGPEVDKKERRGRVTGIGFSADEKIAYEVVDGKPTYESSSVRLWDVESGKVIQDFVVATSDTTYYTRISNFALSNDRRFVALTQAKGNPIEIWEVASGTKRGEFAGHEGRVADLAFSPDDRQLASSSEDTTILVWDMNRPLQPGKFADRLNADELTAQWRTLFDKDAKKADLAIWSLVKASADSLPFLKKHFVPAARPDAKHVQKLLGMLDSSDFRVRSKAEAELEAWGNLVLNDLEKASKEKNALEKQRRIDALLAKARNDVLPFGTPERIAQWRALEVLERIGNTDAIQLVRELANGAEGTQLTIAARNVLARLERAR